jgi:flagellar export protein FliJ
MASKWNILMDLRQRKLEQARDRAQKSLERQHQAAEALEQILEYIEEYRAQFAAHATESVSASTLTRSREFLNQLVESSIEQERMLLTLTQRAQHDHERLVKCRSDLRAIEKLDEHDRTRASKQGARAEAREMDDFARHSHLVGTSGW